MNFLSFLSGLNWELIISFGSLCISGFILVSNHMKSKESYDISVIDYAKPFNHVFQMLIVITNYSDSPLTISSVYCAGTICELQPKKIRGVPGQFGFCATPQFPLCIPAHGCQYVYLEFLNYPHTAPTPGTTLSLKIYSTRKMELKNVLLGDISHYLHTKEQLRVLRERQEKSQK